MSESWRRACVAFGICCLTLSFSLTGFLADGHGGLSFPWNWAKFHEPPVAASPSPSPAALAIADPQPGTLPIATTRPRHGMFGNGPITLHGEGNVALGLTRTNRNDFTQQISDVGSQMTVGLERRTDRASIAISDQVGYASGATSFGQLEIGYTTPQYVLAYGAVAGPAQTQLDLGGLAKGVSLTIPRRNGQLSLIGATAAQTDGTTYRIFGARREDYMRSATVATSLFYGKGEGQNGGRETIFDVVFRRYGKISTTTEAAFNETHGVSGIDDGRRVQLAFQGDISSPNGFTSLSVREAPSGFATLTQIVPPSLDVDMTVRRDVAHGASVSVDLAESDQRNSDGTSKTRRLTTTLTRSLGFGSATLLANVATNTFNGVATVDRSLGLSLSQNVRGFSLSESGQVATVSGDTGSASQRELDFGVTRNVLGGSLSFVASNNVASGGGSVGLSTVQSDGVRYTRPVGRKLDLTLAENVLSSDNGGLVTHQSSTSLGITRRLSNFVALHVAGQRTIQTGVGAGTGNSIAVDLVGPLSFGGTRYTGRSNPNVPATIRGIVAFEGGPLEFGAQSAGIRGFGNVLVILDGRITQRTDARGTFEFRFIDQGTHTVSIEPSSLAPGLVPDHSSETLRVLGGQVVQVNFGIGSFAGVGGQLTYVKDGKDEPISGVSLVIDGVQRVTTAPDGRYQLGRLTPGPHKVAIVADSVPSSVQFDATEKNVVVTQGNITKADFSAKSLGSIGGRVLLAADAGGPEGQGAKDVYVVAQPGDHAAITAEDGTYLLDNLAAGSYTVEVDKETLPDGVSVLQGVDGPVTVAAGQHIDSAVFKLGTAQKDVVFTYGDGKRMPISVALEPQSVPPGALVTVSARTTAKGVKTLFAESDVLGTFPLRFNAAAQLFESEFLAPQIAKGTYALTVTSHGSLTSDGDATLTIDPTLKLVALRINPAHPLAGHAVHVVAKILAPVFEGDTLIFEDGYSVKLPKPVRRIFSFDARVWERGLPYSGYIVTRTKVRVPLILR